VQAPADLVHINSVISIFEASGASRTSRPKRCIGYSNVATRLRGATNP